MANVIEKTIPRMEPLPTVIKSQNQKLKEKQKNWDSMDMSSMKYLRTKYSQKQNLKGDYSGNDKNNMPTTKMAVGIKTELMINKA